MMERRLFDTNVILRHLTQDDAKLAKSAGQLFARCDRGEIEIVLLTVVLAECVYVLESFYDYPRDRIAELLSLIVAHTGVEIIDRSIHLDALMWFAKTKFHFVDCLLASSARASNTAVASFDRDLKRFGDIRIAID